MEGLDRVCTEQVKEDRPVKGDFLQNAIAAEGEQAVLLQLEKKGNQNDYQSYLAWKKGNLKKKNTEKLPNFS